MLATTTLATRSRYLSRPALRFAAAAACAALLLASTTTARAANLSVGNVYTFSTGSTPAGTDPAGTWTIGDKSFTYLTSTGFSLTSPGGDEAINISDNANQYSFGMGQLNSLGAGTYVLGYRLNILPSSSYVLASVELSTTHLATPEAVAKDVYSTFDLFTTAGDGDLAHLFTVNNSISVSTPLSGQTQVWVRDTIVIGAGGAVQGLANNFNQQLVPEIDATSFAGAFPLLVGGLALLERRRRKPTGDAALSGS